MKVKKLIKPIFKTLLVTTVLVGLVASLFGCSSATSTTCHNYYNNNNYNYNYYSSKTC